MIDIMNDGDDNNIGPADYFNGIIADLEGSTEVYFKMRNRIMAGEDLDDYFMRNFNCRNITEYLEMFDLVYNDLEWLYEQALMIEDYEFCKVLVNKRLWAHWKSTTIENEMELGDIEL